MSLIKPREYFSGFANVWTPVLGSAQLKSAPVPLTVAGEKLVLFRGASGPAALFDHCPHRGVALSLGQVREGCIQCPFHGWRFDETGAARLVPWNPEAKTEPLRAMSVPVAEVGGLVWLYTAPGTEAPELPPLAKLLARRAKSVVTEQLSTTHWSRVMENALDAPHLPFVHRWTIGLAARASAENGGRMETSFNRTEYGGEIQWSIDGATSGPNQGWIRYYAPNVMQLGFQADHGALPEQLLAVVPVDGARTRSLSILAPGLSFFKVMDFLIADRLRWEDRHVVETHDPPEIPPGSDEVSVRSDRATLAFRALYDTTLRRSFAVAPAARGLP